MPLSNGNEAINLLSLDGGGVRGASSLVILHDIMLKIKERHEYADIPKPCDIFHLIGGTSTGGLIAIMLGRLRMSTEEALREYDECAQKIFSNRNSKRGSLSEWYKATALEKVVEDLVKRRGMGKLMREPTDQPKGKSFVCVMPAKKIGEPRLVRSYQGGDNWDKDIQILEAARATTAASTFFKPMELKDSVTEETAAYIDAAIGCNNPVDYVLKEAVATFGLNRRLGCIVSIGTGTRRNTKVGRSRRRGFSLGGLKRRGKFVMGILGALKNTATDAETPHQLLEHKLNGHSGAYFRFSVPNAADKVKLDAYKKVAHLKTLTTDYLSGEKIIPKVQETADVLEEESPDHRLALGHVHGLDKEQIIPTDTKAQLMGTTSPFFTARDKTLDRLVRYFDRGESKDTERREFMLHGMGGVGKSQIALRIAEMLKKNGSVKHVFWIDGSSTTTVDQSYANIALDKGWGEESTRELKRLALRKIGELSEEWFMIFDNCTIRDRIAHLPLGNTGNIIYTTRRTLELSLDFKPESVLLVKELKESDAIALLLKASGPEYSLTSPRDVSLARNIVKELGCLPLAIDQAAAYVRAEGQLKVSPHNLPCRC